MTFDPMKFYEDGKRRESRWGAVTPFILVGLLLLVMGVAGYFGYKGARPKHTLGSPAIIPYTKLKAGPGTGGVCVYRQGEGWICGDPALSHPELSHAFHVTPRKHKRKVDGHLVWYDFKFTPSPNQPYESWRFINTIPAELSCTKRTKTSGIHCESRPLTPAEVEQYKPMTEKPTVSDGSMWSTPQTTWGAGDWKPTEQIVPTPTLHQHKPDCVMPADIDVCPVQMLDPKASHD